MEKKSHLLTLLFFIMLIKYAWTTDKKKNLELIWLQEDKNVNLSDWPDMNDVIENNKFDWIEMLSEEVKTDLIAMITQAIEHHQEIDQAILDIAKKFDISTKKVDEAIEWIKSKSNIQHEMSMQDINEQSIKGKTKSPLHKIKYMFGIILKFLDDKDITKLQFTSKYFVEYMQEMWELRLRLEYVLYYLNKFDNLTYYDEYEEKIIRKEHKMEFLFNSNVLQDFPENKIKFAFKNDAHTTIYSENAEQSIKMVCSNGNAIGDKFYNVYCEENQGNEWGNVIFEQNLFFELILQDFNQCVLKIFDGEKVIRQIQNPITFQFESNPFLSPIKIL